MFIHGIGAAGPHAWPHQRTDPRFARCAFMTRPGFGPEEVPVETDWGDETTAVVDAIGRGAHLVGWSFGGIAALLAAVQHPERVRSLCLLEPAAFSVARGDPAVERHVAAVSAVLARRDELAAPEFFIAFMEALGRRDVEPPVTDEQIVAAERLRLVAAPWEAPVDARIVARVPTLVLTGGWNSEYEATAQALDRAGAKHQVLEGAGHRVQDDPRFNELLAEFWSKSDSHRG